jgi:hypothetical protein
MKHVIIISIITTCFLAGSVFSVGAQPVSDVPVVRTQKKSKGEVPAESKKKKLQVSSKKDNLAPMAIFADIESGWKKEAVASITKHFGASKVAIAIEGIGPAGGVFSRDQSHYLFKDLFKFTITEKFEFVQYRNVSDGKIKVYAVAERSYKRNGDGRLFKDKIYVSLHMEEDRWVLSEIKSVR